MPRGGKREGAGRKPLPLTPEERAAKAEAKKIANREYMRRRAAEAKARAAAEGAAPAVPAAPRRAATVLQLRKPPAVAEAPAQSAEPPAVVDDVNADLSPLDYVLQVMRDPKATAERRDRMALRALEILHPVPKAGGGLPRETAPAPVGKREEQAQAAAAVAGGSRLRPLAPPPTVRRGG